MVRELKGAQNLKGPSCLVMVGDGSVAYIRGRRGYKKYNIVGVLVIKGARGGRSLGGC